MPIEATSRENANLEATKGICWKLPSYPSLEEIQRECQRIQAGWSDAERAKRAGFSPTELETPVTTLGAAEGRRDRG